MSNKEKLENVLSSIASSGSMESMLIKNIMQKPLINLEQREPTEEDVRSQDQESKINKPINFLGLL